MGNIDTLLRDLSSLGVNGERVILRYSSFYIYTEESPFYHKDSDNKNVIDCWDACFSPDDEDDMSDEMILSRFRSGDYNVDLKMDSPADDETRKLGAMSVISRPFSVDKGDCLSDLVYEIAQGEIDHLALPPSVFNNIEISLYVDGIRRKHYEISRRGEGIP